MTTDTAGRPEPGSVHRIVFRAELAADPAKVWDLIGAFDSLPHWHPLVANCVLEDDAGGGAVVRRTRLHDGTVIRNRLLEHDDRARQYSYEFVEGPLEVKSYRATLRVAARTDGGAAVEWVSEFEADAETAESVGRRVDSLVSPGLDNLKRIFGGAET